MKIEIDCEGVAEWEVKGLENYLEKNCWKWREIKGEYEE